MGTQILLNVLLSTAFFWCQWIRSVVLNFNLFIVEIPKNKNVNVLIKEKNPASSGNIDVKNIYKNSCQWDRKSFCRKRSAWSYKFYSNFTRWNVYCMPPVECYWNHVEKLQALQGSYTTGMEYYWAAIESKLEQTRDYAWCATDSSLSLVTLLIPTCHGEGTSARDLTIYHRLISGR